MVPSEQTVTIAIGHGKKAARNIDAYQRGGHYSAPGKHQLAGFGCLNTWYCADALTPEMNFWQRDDERIPNIS